MFKRLMGIKQPNTNPGPKIDKQESNSAKENKTSAEANLSKPLQLKGHTGTVFSVALSQDVYLAVSGSYDKTLRVWNLKTGECVRELKGHTDAVHSVAISQDGTLALSGSYDKTIRLWNVKTGECVRELKGHTYYVHCVALSPDGNVALSGSGGTLRVWDLKTGKCIRELRGHIGMVRSVAICLDKDLVLSGSSDSTLYLWNLKTGERIWELKGHASTVHSVAISQDGTLALSGSNDSVRIWNLKTGEYVRELKGHTSDVHSVAIYQQGDIAFSGSYDKTLRVWNLKTGECIRVLNYPTIIYSLSFLTHQNQVYALAGLADGDITFQAVYNLLEIKPEIQLQRSQVVTVKSNSSSLIQSHASLQEPKFKESKVGGEANLSKTLQLKGHTDAVRSVAIGQDGNLALSGSSDYTLRLWNLKTGYCVREFKGHTDVVHSVAISQIRNLVLSGSWDNTLRIWNLETGECVRELKGHTDYVRSVALSQDANYALSGGDDKILRLWNLRTGDCALELKGHTGNVWSVALSQDGNYALSGGSDTILRLWNLKTGVCARIFKGHTTGIFSFALSQDGNLALSASNDGNLRMWNLNTGTFVSELTGHTDYVRSVAISQDGNYALSGGDDKTIRVWDLKTAECIQILNCSASIFSIATLTHKSQVYALAGFADGSIIFQPVYNLPETKPSGIPKPEIRRGVERKDIQELKEIKEVRELEDTKEKKEDFETRLAASFKIDYSILKFGQRLGEGGFGIVYQGTKGQEDVAIKQLKIDHISEDAREEFETEVQTMAKLRSKYIVQFYGYCLSPRYTIVMEFMPKGALTRLLLSKENMSWELRARIMTDMACGLSVLHTANILHRDIKSLNVLLNDQFHAKFSDFGLSKVKTETRTSTKSVGGTLQWMAPELFSLRPKHTKASDVYSLGVTFWEIAARNLPYSGAAEAVIKDAIKNGEREQIPEDCPKRFATLIQACWDGKVENRPDSDTIVAYIKSEQSDFRSFLPSFLASRNVNASTHSYVGNLNSANETANSSSLSNSSFTQSLLSNLASGKS